ncbi:MAG: hypothetical protein N2Z65_07245 [Clostridiales bacterium]|nr:hypothetical protein [Clostridiales bacterium]
MNTNSILNRFDSMVLVRVLQKLWKRVGFMGVVLAISAIIAFLLLIYLVYVLFRGENL